MKKTRHNNARKTGRRLYMQTLESPYDICIYCFSVVAWRELLMSVAEIIDYDKRYITFRVDGVTTRMLVATIEHVTRLCDGGTNAAGNITAACDFCNARENDKEQVRQTKLRRKARRRAKLVSV